MKNRQHIIVTFVLLFWGMAPAAEGQDINVTKLKINTKFNSEIAPVVRDSVLYFVSNRKSSVLPAIFNQDKKHLYKVYAARLLPNGKTGKATLFQPDKSFNLSAGSVAFSPDGSYHIATFNKIPSLKKARSLSKNSEIKLGLFESQRTGADKWSEYRQISFSENNSCSFAQPTISPDGQTLVYVSDMDGGYGKTDLYYSTRTPYGWSNPKNMGENINSTASEIFPFFHSSGALCFSSDRQGGQGGFDIYRTEYNDGEWSRPFPMASPINSQHDDFGCYYFPDGTSGFFASSREGTDNVYRFDYVMEFCSHADEVEEENYCFTFFEERAILADTIPVRYQWTFSDGTKLHGIEVEHCFPGPGHYEIELSVIDSVTDELLYSVANHELYLERPRQVYFYLPEKTKAGTSFTMTAELTGFGEVENVRYFWSVNGSEPVSGKTFNYEFRRKGVYTIQCEAYRDNAGTICSQRKLTAE